MAVKKIDVEKETDWGAVEREAGELLRELFPICRSITGMGLRQTLAKLKEVSDFDIKEVPSGTECYDWIIPDEWEIRSAFIADESGRRIVDFKNSNLHVVSYSIPVDQKLTGAELKKHLHTLPHLPEAIPYRTSYYHPNWGFCLSYREYSRIDANKIYQVKIDSTLKPGFLSYGEVLLPGKSGEEYLIHTYCCHPSLANDNLSGQVLWALLLRELKRLKLRHSYRFVIAPETIGAIAYLAKNEKVMKKVSGGFVITTVAGP